MTSLNEHDPLQGELRRERSIFIIDAVVRGTASPKTSCFSSDHPSRLLGPAQQPLQKESHVADLSPQIAWPLSLSTIVAKMAGGITLFVKASSFFDHRGHLQDGISRASACCS